MFWGAVSRAGVEKGMLSGLILVSQEPRGGPWDSTPQNRHHTSVAQEGALLCWQSGNWEEDGAQWRWHLAAWRRVSVKLGLSI